MLTTRQWYWLAVGAVVCVLALYTQRRDFYSLYLNYQQSDQEVRMLEERLEAKRVEETGLEQLVAGLDSDSLEQEAAIRRSRGLVREGEKVYRVVLHEKAPH